MAVRIEQNAEPIPGYRLLERLGGGGFGEVWRAEAPGGIHKAIKFVFGDLSSAGDKGQRAEQELKALKRVLGVRHPYILSLERYDIIDGQLMIVMELADRNLWDRYKECRARGLPGIPRDELLRYMEEAAEALDLMNSEYQLQHLDIKPQNLFLVHNHIKVADFGLVKDLEGSHASVTGGITPVYAAPETFENRVTRYSDQYSLAIVYQELLTGQRPLAGGNVRQLILSHLQGVPNVSPLPPGEQGPIARALSKAPEQRYPTCRDLVRALRNADGPRGRAEDRSEQPLPTTILHAPSSERPAEGGSWPGMVTPGPSDPATASARGALAETPSAQGITQNIRGLDPILREQQAAQETVRAPQEISGDGVLFPAVVIGLGQVGLSVLQKTRELIDTHAGPLSQLGNLRFLLIDTDPEVMRQATRGTQAAALGAGETLIASLNRPSHYLKPRDGRPPLESWLNPRMLYRIPRSQVTTGVRALGRLAFCDNYRGVVRRLQLELETVLEPQALQEAVRSTGLGLRSNRPRVYVVTCLGGGTGSGMFLDVAYNVRALLRQMGYDTPDVVGLLLLPPVDSNRARLLSLGNTYAALSELYHYGSPGKTFRAKYHEREAAIQDSDPPFGRTIVVPLPDEGDEVATQEVVEQCGQLLYRDLVTPLGRCADLARAGLPGPPWEQRGQYFQTFGLFHLAWPRHALLRAVSRHLCQRVVQRWLSKDSKPIRQDVQQWIAEQWVQQELGADSFIHALQTEVIAALGRPPDSLFDEAVEPLVQGVLASVGAGEKKGLLSSLAARSTTVVLPLDTEQLTSALERLEELVGRPDEAQPREEARLERLLREAADRAAGLWGQKLAELPVQLIEEPAFRLAGAEEAIRQMVATLEQALQHHEPLARELTEKARNAYVQLRQAANAPRGGSKPGTVSAEQLVELCRWYPRWRFRSLVLHHLAAAFVGLRGHLSDELREVNFCRVRLTELLRLFEEVPPGEVTAPLPASKQGSLGRQLFVSDCKNLPEAVARFLGTVKAEHLLELDGRMEAMLQASFTALVHVCLSNQNLLRQVEKAMLETASAYVAENLPRTSVAGLFLEQFHKPEEAEAELADFYHQARPEVSTTRTPLGGTTSVELSVLAAPAEPASEQLLELLRNTVPQGEVHLAGSPEDVLIYRERLNLPLLALEHVGPQGLDAYNQMTATDHFTPHSRTDVDFRR